jgi:energy-coupling factor transporter ATP-binding protein EcfA2
MTGFSRPRHRRRIQPIVSPTPPQAQMPQGSGPRASVQERGRIIGVFGPPGSGVSTMLRVLAGASSLHTAVVAPDFDDLEPQVRQAAQTSEVVLLDGYPPVGVAQNGQPAGPRAVQYLYDRRLIFPGSGALVRVQVDPELILRAGRATEAGIHAWFAGLTALESHIRTLGLPYFVVHNEPGEEGLTQAVGDLARRASIAR